MAKIFLLDSERCNGCRLCEIVCSVTKEGVSDPSRSRIRVCGWDTEGMYLPLVCLHCENPLCASVCPVIGIQRDDELNRVVADNDRCVTCRACVSICPHGGLTFDSKDRKILRCDLCGGDPACAKVCEPNAIQYVDSDVAVMTKKRSGAKRICELIL